MFNRRRSRRVLMGLLAVFILLAIIRVLLPFIVRDQVNRRLAELEGFYGHVDEIDIALLRGAYQLKGVSFSRVVDGDNEPMLDARAIDFSLSWGELFKGRVRSDIAATDIVFTYVPVEREEETADLGGPDWRDVISDLFPIEIEHLRIHSGRVQYRDLKAAPPVDISLESIELAATGLSNRATGRETGELPASIAAEGTTIGGGSVSLRVKAAPLAPEPLFDLDLSIENVSLPALNDYMRAYNNIDVSGGNLNLYTEISARGGHFEGYVKPLFDNLSFEEMEGESDQGLATSLWESFIGIVAEIFEYTPRDQVGARIPISGEFGQPEVGFWSALGSLFRHGFIQALTERIEGQTLNESTPDTPESGES